MIYIYMIYIYTSYTYMMGYNGITILVMSWDIVGYVTNTMI